MRKIWAVISIFLVCLWFAACSNKEINTSSVSSEAPSKIYRYPTSSSESVESTPKRYHLKLHDSDLQIPSKGICLAAQKQAFSGMSKAEIELVQTTIREWHMELEWEFVNNNMRENLQDPDSQYWEAWEHTGVIHYDYISFVNDYDGATIINSLQKLVDVVKDSDLQADLREMQQIIQSAVEHHSIDDLDTLHRMLHDCDYWLVNYPAYLETPPGDWDGINVYFDCLESLKQ